MGWFKSQMWKVLEWKDESQDTMVHRFDMQGKEIMSGSQLTVRESQAGVFVHQGKIADVFGPGQHKLTTRNLPILSAIGSIWYQGESRFKAELYFVNTKQFVDCKWGTNNPITMRDKEFGAVRVRAFGNYSFRVNDPAEFLREVFGTNGKFGVQDIESNLKSILVSQMSDTIAESGISALDMAMNYQEFGNMIRDNAQAKFDAIGLELTDFNIINISLPEAVEKAIDERASLGILADQMGTYTQKKAADALGDAAKNPVLWVLSWVSVWERRQAVFWGRHSAVRKMPKTSPRTVNSAPNAVPKSAQRRNSVPNVAKNLCRETPARPAENPLEKVRNSVPNAEKN